MMIILLNYFPAYLMLLNLFLTIGIELSYNYQILFDCISKYMDNTENLYCL